MICPWAAGGGSDRVARKVAELLGSELKQKVNLVNRIGGGGAIGFTAGATAEPNGYTLTFFTTEIGTLHWMGITNLNYKSFINIALVNSDPAGIIVRMDAPWRTLEQLQNAIHDNPGKLKASGTGKGGIWDLCRAGWLRALGYKINNLSWYPSDGAAPALQQLETGRVDIVICGLAEASSALQSGKVRALAIMATKRDPHFKRVPTLIQKRINFADGSFRGVAVPLGTPSEVVTILENAMEKVVKSRGFKDFMQSNGFGTLYLRKEKLAAFLEERDKAFGSLIREAGLAGQ
jgi:tripartite-type tricarboxylate transporter receptor subunit TctC